eukprot:TRINITY_DN14019_c0_g1_i1.p1 TRINITY_DN14019_c0_g1~~TRINITY_DN14019_c0_g1_i1.p1  ORF type:complete len:904 (-),score=180.74 TRINITY_DN14019_c0_g1_i1:13-2724(-)
MLPDLRRLRRNLPDASPESHSSRSDGHQGSPDSLSPARRLQRHPSRIEQWLQSELQAHGLETALPCAERLQIHNQALALLGEQWKHCRPLLQSVFDEVAANLLQIRRLSEEIQSVRLQSKKWKAEFEALAREHQYDYMAREGQMRILEASMHAEMRSKIQISELQAESKQNARAFSFTHRKDRLALSQLEDQKLILQKELAEAQNVSKLTRTLRARVKHESEQKNDLSAKIQRLNEEINILNDEIKNQVAKLKEHENKKAEMERGLEAKHKELERLHLLKGDRPEDMDLRRPSAIEMAARQALPEVRLMQINHPDLCTIRIADWLEVFRCCTEDNKKLYMAIKDHKNSGKCVKLYDVDAFYVRPWTRKTGCGVSLLMSQNSTAPAGMMLSHSWAEDLEELVEAVETHVKQNRIPESVRVWFCLFSLYQPGGEEGDEGPTISDQLRLNPFGRVVNSDSLKAEHGYGMNVVHTSQADVYQRLWCVYELHCALETKNLEVTKSMSRKYFDNTAEKLREWMEAGRVVNDSMVEESNSTRPPGQLARSLTRRESVENMLENDETTTIKTYEELLLSEWETFLWVAGVKVKSATALCSSAEDKRKIISHIQSQPGGFDKIDTAIEAFRREQLEGDLDMMHQAIEVDAMFYKFASDLLKKDAGLVKHAVAENGEALQFVPKDAPNYREAVLEAVKQNGESLRFASDELKADAEVIRAAVQNTPDALQYCDQQSIDPDIAEQAVKRDPRVLRFLEEELYEDMIPVASEKIRERHDSVTTELADIKKARETWLNSKAVAAGTGQSNEDETIHAQAIMKTLKFVGQALLAAVKEAQALLMDKKRYDIFLKHILEDTQKAWSQFTQVEKRDSASLLSDGRFGLDQEIRSTIFPKELYELHSAHKSGKRWRAGSK